LNRRDMLRLAGVTLVPAAAKAGATAGPRFFDVKAFGAAGDGKTLDTSAINRAIDACNAAGCRRMVSTAGM
jgi:polygalacturonase